MRVARRVPRSQKTELLHPVPQGVAGETKHLRGFRLVPLGRFQRLAQEVLLDVLEDDPRRREAKTVRSR